jgi:RsiW-degrading membrane proteinase PrsW (M82 family)
VIRVFLWGCALTLPAVLLEKLTNAQISWPTLWQSFAASFFLIAPIEESFKLLAVWLGIYRRRDFREPVDGLVYSITAALGFATVENVVYMAIFGPSVIWLRAALATPAHVMFSVMWGYSMGLARFRRNRELLTILKGLTISVLLHGTYNSLVAVSPVTGFMTLIPLMIFMGWLMFRRMRDFRLNQPFPPLGKGPLIWCPMCGAYTIEGDGCCPRCGTRVPPVETDVPRFCGKCRARLDPGRDTCYRCGQTVATTIDCPPAACSV